MVHRCKAFNEKKLEKIRLSGIGSGCLNITVQTFYQEDKLKLLRKNKAKEYGWATLTAGHIHRANGPSLPHAKIDIIFCPFCGEQVGSKQIIFEVI